MRAENCSGDPPTASIPCFSSSSRTSLRASTLTVAVFRIRTTSLGKPAGPATDLFAFGVLLYQMLTGEKPWQENDRWNADPIPLRQRRPEAPKHWDEAIARCLRRDPAERPQTVEELAGLLDVMPMGASSAERAVLRPRPRVTRWRWVAAVLFAVVALLGWMFRDQWQGQETQTTGDGWQIALLPFEAIGESCSCMR